MINLVCLYDGKASCRKECRQALFLTTTTSGFAPEKIKRPRCRGRFIIHMLFFALEFKLQLHTAGHAFAHACITLHAKVKAKAAVRHRLYGQA